jgi:hypothetical protein
VLDFVWRRAAEWIWIRSLMIGGGQYDEVRDWFGRQDKATVSLRASRVVSVCLHIVLDGTVTARTKRLCRFGKGVWNQYPQRHPSQRGGLPRVLGMMSTMIAWEAAAG